ncbi:uncharacterized protein A4U43_C08F7860 [Asparagus officinalis]|nr:uncharacterized protein A4U43_C08F7860 [Asparagus officinalis]
MGLNMLDALSDYIFSSPSNGTSQSSESRSTEDENLSKELHESLVPSALRVPWADSEFPIHLHFYYIRFVPVPADRKYRMFGLFLKNRLPREAETLEIDLHLHHSRIVKTALVPSGVIKFDKDQIMLAEKFQEIALKIILERSLFFSDIVLLGDINEPHTTSSTFYLLLPVKMQDYSDDKLVDWETVGRCINSPAFGYSIDSLDCLDPVNDTLELHNGTFKKSDIMNSLVFTPHNKKFFFIDDINQEKNVNSHKNDKYATYEAYYKERGVELLYPEQPFLVAKRLANMHNLLCGRVQTNKEVQDFKEYFEEFPPEICVLKVMGFSKDIGSSLVLLPSLIHHVENLLVAIELKDMLSTSIPEISEIRADTVLQALTTQKCSARHSLERFEVLGDAFLKYIVGRHSFLSYPSLDEGQLTIRRAGIVNNSNLYELAIKNNLQVYIRDELFHPSQFYAFGRPCKVICNVDTETTVHHHNKKQTVVNGVEVNDVKCTKSHRWLSRKTIADVVESLAGAFLVEIGFTAAISFLRWIGIEVDFDTSDVGRFCEETKNNMSLADNIDLDALETLIGYKFQYRGLLLQAFVHPSCHNHSGGCYQRLEFLGDAALEYLITSYLYSVYPELNPGQITDLRSAVVNNKSFAYIAVGRSFYLYLKHNSCGLAETINKFSRYVQLPDLERDFLEEPACPKILGDIVESCVGAILVDTGFNLKVVWKIILGLLKPTLEFSSLQLNHVRELRELCQSVDLTFELPKPLKRKEGYLVSVEIDVKGNKLTFSAVNHNSKTAQKMAAQEALLKLKALGFKHKRRSLQQIVQSTRKEAAELIGFNEEPIPISNGDSSSRESFQEPERISSKLSQEPEVTPSKLPQELEKTSSELPQDQEKSTSVLSINTKVEGSPTARMQLYELCAAKHWERPSFV